MTTCLPEHLTIPRAVACRYARAAAARGIDIDDVESLANLAFALALAAWDEARSPGGVSGLGGWLHKCVSLRVRGALAGTISLDRDTLQMARAVPSREPLPGEALEIAEEAAAVLASLPPRQREALALLREGLFRREAAERMGVSRQMVDQYATKAKATARERWEGVRG